MNNQPWQCPYCGTVYAWWVPKCDTTHKEEASHSKKTRIRLYSS